ncbi:MAG: glycoside hydrolase family 43 protein [Candidatus Dormibacteraceae bacterium]
MGRTDALYALYYTAHRAHTSGRNDVQCIGVALSSTPGGPFTPSGPAGDEDGHRPLVCPVNQGGAIDADTFTDLDGTHFLLYKTDGNRIAQPSRLYLQEMAADGLTLIGRPRLMLESRPGAPENGVIEAPDLRHHGSHYILFYSAGPYVGKDYYTSYAMADSVTGPYQRADQPLMTTGSLGGNIIGPGGAMVVPERTGDHIVFHGYIDNKHTVRGLYTSALAWDANDNPVISGSTPRQRRNSRQQITPLGSPSCTANGLSTVEQDPLVLANLAAMFIAGKCGG